MKESRVDYYSPSRRRTRADALRRLRLLLLPCAIVVGMLLIPATSFFLHDAYASAHWELEPRFTGQTVSELKDQLKLFFTEEEIDYLEARYLVGKSEEEIVREIDRYAAQLAADDFTHVPREFSEFVKHRTGDATAKALRKRMKNLRPSVDSTRRPAPGELYRSRDLLPDGYEYANRP